MAKLDPKLEKWIHWIEVIQDDVTHLVMAKDIFWSVQSLITANPQIQKHTVFYWYMGDTYVAYALMGIRRQAKHHDKSISLAGLISEIAQEPTKISRQYYRSLYGPNKARFADKDLNRYCEKPGDAHISAAMVQRDLDKLASSASGCEAFADRRIAHRDKRRPATLPKFEEADRAIDTLHDLCLKYRLIVLADYQTSLLPTYQYDWQEVFDHAWRQPESPR